MKIILKLITVVCISLCLIVALFCSITSGPKTFDNTYQSVIQRKYDLLKNTNNRKIIIVGGSSAGFGINSDLLEKETKYKVVNMGLHAGFGNLFNTEIAKANINQGDIIVLAYEYSLNNDSFEKLGDIDLIMSGIDNYLEMYKMVPILNQKEIYGNIFNYAVKKYTYNRDSNEGSVYSSFAFDKKGNMTYKRDSFVIDDYENKKDVYGFVDMKNQSITSNNIQYLKKFKKYIEKKKAKVYLSVPPIYKSAISGTDKEFQNYVSQMELTGIKCISNPKDYIFSKKYMYDTIYHCNSKGEQKRTKLLANDLQKYLE